MHKQECLCWTTSGLWKWSRIFFSSFCHFSDNSNFFKVWLNVFDGCKLKSLLFKLLPSTLCFMSGVIISITIKALMHYLFQVAMIRSDVFFKASFYFEELHYYRNIPFRHNIQTRFDMLKGKVPICSSTNKSSPSLTQ